MSRALRNRCLQIDVEYTKSVSKSAEPECVEDEIAQLRDNCNFLIDLQDYRVFNAYHESIKFDLYPVLRKDESKLIANVTTTGALPILGKR